MVQTLAVYLAIMTAHVSPILATVQTVTSAVMQPIVPNWLVERTTQVNTYATTAIAIAGPMMAAGLLLVIAPALTIGALVAMASVAV